MGFWQNVSPNTLYDVCHVREVIEKSRISLILGKVEEKSWNSNEKSGILL